MGVYNREQNRIKVAFWRARQRNVGKCYHCGEAAAPNRSLCARHLLERRKKPAALQSGTGEP